MVKIANEQDGHSECVLSYVLVVKYVVDGLQETIALLLEILTVYFLLILSCSGA